MSGAASSPSGIRTSRMAPGTLVLRGRYRLLERLGEGGMGVVWSVEDTANGAQYAIKFVKDSEASEKSQRRLEREAATTGALAHPNIVRIFEVADDEDGTAAIVMELLSGESLGERIDRSGPQSLGQTCAILRDVAGALDAAHGAGVIHRDLKPDNIFLTQSGEELGVRVLDFGLAKRVDLPKDSLTVTGAILGTPTYMSPEQAAGERLDAATDVWSLAVIAFECLVGFPPVSGENYGQLLARLIRGDVQRLADVMPELPNDVIATIDGALLPRPSRRTDLRRFRELFAKYGDEHVEVAPPWSGPPAEQQSSPRKVDQRSNSSQAFEATQIEAPRPPDDTRPRWGIAVVTALVVVVAGSFAATQVLLRAAPPAPRGEGTASSPPSPAPTAPTVSASVSATTTAPEPPRQEATAASQEATSPVAPRTAPPPSRQSPTASGTAAASGKARAPTTTPAPATSASGPTRLSGGVAGDVPF